MSVVPLTLFAAASIVFTGSSSHETIAAFILMLPMAAALTSVAVAAHRTEGLDAPLWAWASVAMFFIFIGEIADILRRLGAFQSDALPSILSLIAFLIAGIFGSLSLWNLARPPISSIRALAGYATDLVVIQLVAFAGILTLVLPVAGDGSPLGLWQVLTMSLYPSIAIGIVAYGIAFKRTPWGAGQILLIAWLAALGARHDVLLATAQTAYNAPLGSSAGSLTDIMLVLSYCSAVVAGMLRVKLPTEDTSHSLAARRSRQPVWPSFAAPVLVMAMAPAIYLRANGHKWTPEQVWVMVAVAMLIGITITVRSYLLNTENTQLWLSSTTDPLTRLANHRQFHERLAAEVHRATREETPVSLVAIDVDDFDRVNNVYGHGAGDRRLCAIADRLATSARLSDVICRVGGDEFAIIMPDTTPVEAYKVCLRIQDLLRDSDDDCPLPVSVSIGIAGLPDHARTREHLVERADGALYWAKFHGRENIIIFDPDLVLALGPEQRIALLRDEAYVNMVQLLASAVDARDSYTQRHSRNVGRLAVELGQRLGLDAERCKQLETAALLHDIGKIGVSDAVLRKEGVLTSEETARLREHPRLAARILSATPRPEILPWVAAHHERWDGTGYPDGLAGADIPFEARIITVCDAYDAITSDRPDRPALEPTAARAEILDNAGSQFDPELAAEFVAMLLEHADD